MIPAFQDSDHASADKMQRKADCVETMINVQEKVHAALSTKLTAAGDESLRVIEQDSTGREIYGFNWTGARLTLEVSTTPYPEFVEIVGQACLGRLHTGYTRALEWLATLHHRNTVYLRWNPKIGKAHDLCVGYSRIMHRDDPMSLHLQMDDFLDEIKRSAFTLNFHFPHLIRGQICHEILRENLGDREQLELFCDASSQTVGLLKSARRAFGDGQQVSLASMLQIAIWSGRPRELEWWLEQARRIAMADGSPPAALVEHAQYLLDLAKRDYRAVLRDLDRVGECRQPEPNENESDFQTRSDLRRAWCWLQLDEPLKAASILVKIDEKTYPIHLFLMAWAYAQLHRLETAKEFCQKYRMCVRYDLIAETILRPLIES